MTMRTTMLKTCFFALLACFAVGLASAGESALDRAQGSWRMDEPPAEGLDLWFSLSGDKLSFSDGRSLYVAADNKDGRTVLRIAGTDIVVCVFTMLGDNSADIFFPEGKTNSRHTKVSMIAVEDVYGYWLGVPLRRGREGDERVLQVSPGFLRVQGESDEPVTMHPMPGEVKILSTKESNPPLFFRFVDPDTIHVYMEGEHGLTLTRLPEAKAKAMMKEEPSRGGGVAANEETAISALKAYATAQVTFQVGKLNERSDAGAKGKFFCDNFRNLYYGRVDGKEIQLISLAMADAFAGRTTGKDTVGNAGKTAIPYKGYLFLEDPGMLGKADQFGLVAYPAQYGVTGNTIYWIGTEGEVLKLDPAKRKVKAEKGKMPPLLQKGESPFVSKNGWERQ